MDGTKKGVWQSKLFVGVLLECTCMHTHKESVSKRTDQSTQNSFMIYFPMNNTSNVTTLVRLKLALFETFSLFQGIQDLCKNHPCMVDLSLGLLFHIPRWLETSHSLPAMFDDTVLGNCPHHDMWSIAIHNNTNYISFPKKAMD